MSNTEASDGNYPKPHLSLFSVIANLKKLQAYPVQTSLSDLPRWSWLSQIRVIGPLVILVRELFAFMLYQLQVRRPWLQQVEFNAQVVSALKLVNQQLGKLGATSDSEAEVAADDELYELQSDMDDRLYAFQLVIDQQARLLQRYNDWLQEHTNAIRELQAENARLIARLEHLEPNIQTHAANIKHLTTDLQSLSEKIPHQKRERST